MLELGFYACKNKLQLYRQKTIYFIVISCTKCTVMHVHKKSISEPVQRNWMVPGGGSCLWSGLKQLIGINFYL